MAAFGDMLKADIDNVFLNLAEFGEKVCIEGTDITAVITECNTTAPLEDGRSYFPQQLIARTEDLPRRLYLYDTIDVDGIMYVIKNISVAGGMTTLMLQRNE